MKYPISVAIVNPCFEVIYPGKFGVFDSNIAGFTLIVFFESLDDLLYRFSLLDHHSHKIREAIVLNIYNNIKSIVLTYKYHMEFIVVHIFLVSKHLEGVLENKVTSLLGSE